MDLGLFTGIPQHENFARIADLIPSRAMRPAARPVEWPEGAHEDLPATYTWDGSSRATADFLAQTDTGALLVLREGQVVHEHYALTGGRDVTWTSFSVAKSYVSALVGIALAEGQIGSVHQPISDYITAEPGSAYDGTPILDVLQMSSGARWSEDFNDPTSDIFRLGAVMAGAGTLEEFVATMTRETEPGTVCRYNSADTQALGQLLVTSTGRSLSDYMQDKVVDPLGMTAPSAWVIDNVGMEMAFAGLALTARDFARIGELYRNDGVWNGNQVVPADWVAASITGTAPHLAPGKPTVGDHTFPFGYGYQWWLPDGGRGEFSAIGIYNQFVYVDPATSAVIVKLSANHAYGTLEHGAANYEDETVAVLRTIARQLS
jgi:CubicO group peptidase (beta-lactamase class C family)